MAALKPDWVKIKPKELEKLVVDLAKRGDSPRKIGLILRDEHGIPKAKLLGKKITQILKENKIKIPSKKEMVNKEIESLRGHIAKNKHDYPAQRSLTKKLWALFHAEKLERVQ